MLYCAHIVRFTERLIQMRGSFGTQADQRDPSRNPFSCRRMASRPPPSQRHRGQRAPPPTVGPPWYPMFFQHVSNHLQVLTHVVHPVPPVTRSLYPYQHNHPHPRHRVCSRGRSTDGDATKPGPSIGRMDCLFDLGFVYCLPLEANVGVGDLEVVIVRHFRDDQQCYCFWFEYQTVGDSRFPKE